MTNHFNLSTTLFFRLIKINKKGNFSSPKNKHQPFRSNKAHPKSQTNQAGKTKQNKRSSFE